MNTDALHGKCLTCNVPFELLAIMPMRVRVGAPPGMGAFYQCPTCLLMRLHEDQCTPDEDYASDEYRDALNQDTTIEQYRKDHELLAYQQAECLKLREGANVIDIGSGPGVLLDVLKVKDPALGTAAVEPSKAYQEHLRGQDVHRVFSDTESAVTALGAHTADYALLMLVLEHVSDPWQMLREARPLLKTGGELCITVPSLHIDRAWGDAAYRRTWFCAQHRWYFSFSALGMMLNECGYKVAGQPQYWNRDDGWVYHHIRGTPA